MPTTIPPILNQYSINRETCGFRFKTGERLFCWVRPIYLGIENIDHNKTKARSLQSNGICERFHKTVPDEFYGVIFRRKVYNNLYELQADLDTWMKCYNHERARSNRCCFGKTPMQTFLDSMPLVKEKMLNSDVQAAVT